MQQNEPSLPDPRLLTRDEVRDLFGLSQRFLEAAVHTGDGPPRIKIGHRTVRYLREDVERWIASRRVGPERAGAKR